MRESRAGPGWSRLCRRRPRGEGDGQGVERQTGEPRGGKPLSWLAGDLGPPERWACEIRLRAERKAGQLLAKMEKAKRGPDKNGSGQRSRRATSDAKTLSEMAISKDQSSRWQALAGVPEEDFEAALGGGEKPTTNSILAKLPQMPPTSLWLWGRLRDIERAVVNATWA